MNILNYILGGKSTFTVVSARTGDRMTYRVTAVPRHPQAIKVANWYWVSVRTGGEKNWTYMGMIFDDCKFKRTAKSKISEGTQEFAGFSWLLRNAGDLKGKAEFLPSGKCCACGRQLTTSKSIAAGIGPECIKNAGRRAA